MPEFLVTWKIDISADSPRKAAQEALDTMRDPGSIATYFELENKETGEQYVVDFEQEFPDADNEEASEPGPFALLQEGDEVYWTDPDEGLSSNYYKVVKVMGEDSTQADCVLFLEGNGSEVEAFRHELS